MKIDQGFLVSSSPALWTTVEEGFQPSVPIPAPYAGLLA